MTALTHLGVWMEAAERLAAMENHSGILDPGVVRLVVEIVSPSSRSMDRLTKPTLYARTGIPDYWRVELDPDDGGPAVHVHRLDRRRYEPAGTATPAEPLALSEPFSLILDPTDLA